jgi:hypothetical protein
VSSFFFHFRGGRFLHNIRVLNSHSGGGRCLHNARFFALRSPLDVLGPRFTSCSPKAFLSGSLTSSPC